MSAARPKSQAATITPQTPSSQSHPAGGLNKPPSTAGSRESISNAHTPSLPPTAAPKASGAGGDLVNKSEHGSMNALAQPSAGGGTNTTVTLNVKVASARNIKGAKGEKVSSFVRIQLADFDFVDSPVVPDNPNPQYDFTWEQTFNVNEALIDTFFNKKLSFTLFESLPKEKTAILGDCALSMAPHFLKYTPRDPSTPDTPPPAPPLTFQQTQPITYTNTRLLGKDADDPARIGPDFEIVVGISRPLIAPEVVEQGTFLALKVNDVAPVPEEWSTKEGNEKDLNSNIYSYALNFYLPAESVQERPISIACGTLVMSDSPIATDPSQTTPQPILLPKPSTAAIPTPTSTTGDPQPTADTTESILPPADTTDPTAPAPALAVIGEPVKKVSWGACGTYTIWVPPQAVVRLREKIVRKEAVEVEFTRTLHPRFAHLPDTSCAKYRGRATLDLSCLLFPRVIGVRGRWPVDVVLPDVQPTPGTADGFKGSSVGLDVPPHGGTTTAGPGGKKRRDEAASANFYKTLGTTLGLELLLEKPLLDKKKLQPITKHVSDFIPPRTIPADLLFTKRSARADEDYTAQLQKVVRKLVWEYEAQMGADKDTGDDQADEAQRRKKFFWHLNRSGAYFEFKEGVKGAVVEVVRERFKRKSPFATPSELHLFMSELYVHLTEKMHTVINALFQSPQSFTSPTSKPAEEFQLLKTWAADAEADGWTEGAEKWHKERVVRFEDSTQAWFDYGCFCMRRGMPGKGEECFREILGRNERHIPSLLAYGSFCCVNERFEESRVFLVTALELQPKLAMVSTILGLLYDILGEEEESEIHITEAQKLHKLATAGQPDAPSTFITAAEFLIHCQAGQMAERALSQEILQPNASRIKPHLLLHQLELQRGNQKLAEEHLVDALEVRQDDPDVWTALGHFQYLQKQWDAAKGSYETVLTLSQEPASIALVYTRLGSLYLRQYHHQIAHHTTPQSSDKHTTSPIPAQASTIARLAKSMYLRACASSANAASWLGVGKACIAAEEWEEAEDALAEANVLNNRHSDVWAYLALLNLRRGREYEGNQCIAQALRLGVRDAVVLREVSTALVALNQRNAAIECLRLCLEIEPQDVATRTTFTRLLDEAPGSETSLFGKAGHGQQIPLAV
ncbi:uncharacterized protein EV422DRAFT_528079 [Fimicolochytrium jonesii]|uniref:uncharacterized protein n=1 Tax=Fimicolochytrium jonesii TaxID=1396493 RepID=UPI0022FE293E|nr:uncharacterized protein EV422DRAFT_528079 [Fimicolochytrium jonesii]KAI8821418.1 hypothetical protein EV422DRAFT_528079 [Fimicolochytrium jonesii]